MLLRPNPRLNLLLLQRRSRLHRSVSFHHRAVLVRVAKHPPHLPLPPHPPLLPLPPHLPRLSLLLLRPRHLLHRQHRQHRQLEIQPRLRHALRCRSVLRPRRRASRFRLRPAHVPRFLRRVSPSRRPPACVAKRLLPVPVLAVVLAVLVLVVLVVLVVVLVAALPVVVLVAEALVALVPVVVLVAAVPVAAVPVAASVVPVADPVVVLVVVLVAAVVLAAVLVVVPVVRVPSARVVVVVTATNFSRSTHRATRLVKHQSRLAKLS